MTAPLLIVMGNQLYPNHKVGLKEGSTARFRLEGGRITEARSSGRRNAGGGNTGGYRDNPAESRAGGYTDSGPAAMPIFMAEDRVLFDRRPCHTHKIMLILSAMRSHRDFLRGRHEVYYYPIEDDRSSVEKLRDAVRKSGADMLAAYEPDDHRIYALLEEWAGQLGLPLLFRPSKTFMLSGEEVRAELDELKRVRLRDFYIRQRKRMGLLLEEGGNLSDGNTGESMRGGGVQGRSSNAEPDPFGGKWIFNEKKWISFPEGIRFYPLPRADWTDHSREIAGKVEELFPGKCESPGKIESSGFPKNPEYPGEPEDFSLPTTRGQALKWMDSFFTYRFPRYGPYRQSIHHAELLGFHSMLSPLLNIGLLLPGEVVEAALAREAPLQCKEAFLRQIVGRREFLRGIYLRHGDGVTNAAASASPGTKEAARRDPAAGDPAAGSLRGNPFGLDRRLARSWYEGTTGLPILDDSIGKVLRYGYVHHNERLNVIGNFMLLSEVHPDEMYRWFAGLFVDAHDWATVPNVYGMVRFSGDEDLATRSCIVCSRYLLGMSDYEKGPWRETVDGLYWRFLHRHRDSFRRDSRMKMRVSMLDRMDSKRYKRLERAALEFIERNS